MTHPRDSAYSYVGARINEKCPAHFERRRTVIDRRMSQSGARRQGRAAEQYSGREQYAGRTHTSDPSEFHTRSSAACFQYDAWARDHAGSDPQESE